MWQCGGLSAILRLYLGYLSMGFRTCLVMPCLTTLFRHWPRIPTHSRGYMRACKGDAPPHLGDLCGDVHARIGAVHACAISPMLCAPLTHDSCRTPNRPPRPPPGRSRSLPPRPSPSHHPPPHRLPRMLPPPPPAAPTAAVATRAVMTHLALARPPEGPPRMSRRPRQPPVRGIHPATRP